MKNTNDTNDQLDRQLIDREIQMFGQTADEVRMEFTDNWKLDVMETLGFAREAVEGYRAQAPNQLLNIAKMRLVHADITGMARKQGDWDLFDAAMKALGLMSDLQREWSWGRYQLALSTVASL